MSINTLSTEDYIITKSFPFNLFRSWIFFLQKITLKTATTIRLKSIVLIKVIKKIASISLNGQIGVTVCDVNMVYNEVFSWWIS